MKCILVYYAVSPSEVSQMDGPLVKGYCRRDFDAVKEVFFSNLKSGAEENVQLCVYVGPELVIDLWGCRNPENPDQYGPNSLQVSGSMARQTFSCKMCSDIRQDSTLLKTFSRIHSAWKIRVTAILLD